jgi:hypothetical protein
MLSLDAHVLLHHGCVRGVVVAPCVDSVHVGCRVAGAILEINACEISGPVTGGGGEALFFTSKRDLGVGGLPAKR